MCILIDTPPTRHQAITDNSQTIVPALLLLFSGLKRAYTSRAEDDDDSDSEDEDGVEGTLYPVTLKAIGTATDAKANC